MNGDLWLRVSFIGGGSFCCAAMCLGNVKKLKSFVWSLKIPIARSRIDSWCAIRRLCPRDSNSNILVCEYTNRLERKYLMTPTPNDRPTRSLNFFDIECEFFWSKLLLDLGSSQLRVKLKRQECFIWSDMLCSKRWSNLDELWAWNDHVWKFHT